jgi:glycosyltransferase involved in cell wall biosynthesis
MKPRIAYVVKMFPRLSETFVLNELIELERRGFALTVYSLKAPAPGPRHPDVARLAARVVVLPERPVAWLGRGLPAALILAARHPGRVGALLRYVASRRTHQAWKRFFQAAVLVRDLAPRPVEHVHAHFASAPSRVAMFAARLAGLPFSFTAHAKDIFHADTDEDLLRAKMRAARFVVTVSDFNRAHLVGLLGGDDRAAVRRLYNGVDLDRFAPGVCPLEREPATVLAVGRLVEKKGFADLLEAWPAVRARVPAARLVIVGDGPQREELARRARDLGVADAVTWAGSLPQDAVRAHLAAATLFVLPCRVARDGNRDGLPTVLLEALASGVPCVTTTVTGNPEIVRDGVEGRLVPPGDPPALADALAGLLLDPDTRARMAGAARASAIERFDLRRNVATLAGWFARVPVAECA